MSGFAVALHLIDVVTDAIDLNGRLLDGLRRPIRSFRCFVGGDLRLGGVLFSLFGGLLSLGGRCFGLLSPLIVVRRAPRNGDRQDENCQH